MSWNKGKDRIDGLVKAGYLQRVPASKRQALALIADARKHLVTAEAIASTDPQVAGHRARPKAYRRLRGQGDRVGFVRLSGCRWWPKRSLVPTADPGRRAAQEVGAGL